jgi:hypothetical protein
MPIIVPNPPHKLAVHRFRERTHSSIPSEQGESFLQDGRRYYWFMRDGRRFYTSHPQPGMVPAEGPGSISPQDLGGVTNLDAPMTPSDEAALHARREAALERLAKTEARLSRFQNHEQHRILKKAAKMRKHPPSLLR